MATLVFGAVGTLIGGPLGGAIGALAGRQIDSAIIGSGSREGPRLKELAVTTSSYGQPLPRHYGRVRVAGTVIWATDLKELRETSSGGKGRPKTTSYSYSSSLAVALSSRPIGGIGRIWADGKLLRGIAGDLKTGGAIRIYDGYGDQQPDPLIAAAQGGQCPAFRNCAYVVFEDLELADFGNRIPALTFELFPFEEGVGLAQLVDGMAPDVIGDAAFGGLQGLSYDGGPVRDLLATVSAAYPLAGRPTQDGLRLVDALAAPENPDMLPEPVLAWDEADFGRADGHVRQRDSRTPPATDILRYYDSERDYQPGLQRAGEGETRGHTRTIEFPGTLPSGTARDLVEGIARRTRWKREILSWRIAELDPSLTPAHPVQVPGMPGLWRIETWEWRERGIELTLAHIPPDRPVSMQGEPGSPWTPFDGPDSPTRLRAFELPREDIGETGETAIFAAASAEGENWAGATLYAEHDTQLVPLGPTGRHRATGGHLVASLPPSHGLLFERQAVIAIDLHADDLDLAPASLDALAAGANRLLVGGEIVQFASAEKVGTRRWQLSGLLRGRGGTERMALAGHEAGTVVTVIDDSLLPLDPARLAAAESRIAAIGRAESTPVFAPIENAGASRRPLMPVHGSAALQSDGTLLLCWIRRARGVWKWRDEIDSPLVEETELYRVGIGPVDAPAMSWETSVPRLVIDAATVVALEAAYSGQPIWVRQVGSFALSDPLLIAPVASSLG